MGDKSQGGINTDQAEQYAKSEISLKHHCLQHIIMV